MPIVFPKRATMIVTPAELDVTTPCGAPALGRPEWDARLTAGIDRWA
jgi:hypothetical protein